MNGSKDKSHCDAHHPIEQPEEEVEPIPSTHVDLPNTETAASCRPEPEANRRRRLAEHRDLKTVGEGQDEAKELGRRLVEAWQSVRGDDFARRIRTAAEHGKAVAEDSGKAARSLDLPASVSSHDLSQTGWGVIFSRGEDPKVEEALAPLLTRRGRQAKSRYKRLDHEPGESAGRFMWFRHLGAPGVMDPRVLPYYLLIVGGPEAISFDFQYELAVNHAVGRIAFDRPEDYRAYANAVVRAEEEGIDLPRRVGVLSVEDAGDPALRCLAADLVTPLSETLEGYANWSVDVWREARARKEALPDLLGGRHTPGLWLASCHGHRSEVGAAEQESLQGALLCQSGAEPGDAGRRFTAADLAAACDREGASGVHGLMAFLFGCYGAGTPAEDNFPHEGKGNGFGGFLARRALAERPFVARLPQELLRRGALAVTGQIDRGWTSAFRWRLPQSSVQAIRTLKDTLEQLLAGVRVGHALHTLSRRQGSIAAFLAHSMERVIHGEEVDLALLGFEWTAYKDARNRILLGDPACYLLGQRCWQGPPPTADPDSPVDGDARTQGG